MPPPKSWGRHILLPILVVAFFVVELTDFDLAGFDLKEMKSIDEVEVGAIGID